MTTQLSPEINMPFTRPAFMNRSKETKGLSFENTSVYYDLSLTGSELVANPVNPARALQVGKREARFPLKTNAANRPLIVDEGMGFPVTLSTALRTGAVYESLDFAKPSSQRYIGAEFFREYVRLLVQPGLNLLFRSGLAFNWAGLGLVLKVNKGVPVALGFFPRADVLTKDYILPLLNSPGNSDCAGFDPDGPSFGLYSNYTKGLLAYALKPLVSELAGYGVREEVLWDIAIEALLEVLQPLDRPIALREAFFIEELSVANLGGTSDPRKTAKAQKGFSFNQGQLIFLKQRCCEKYRKKGRCSNCPGNLKSTPTRLLPLALV
ncbi:MAG: hypothetical protein JWP00_4926 [Chloroflexi bacterium]|nr:hypothetical protein [Chloroflexota bacterium]